MTDPKAKVSSEQLVFFSKMKLKLLIQFIYNFPLNLAVSHYIPLGGFF